MYDARAQAARPPAQLLDEQAEGLEAESTPALELDPEEDQPLTDTAAGDSPEVEPVLGD